MKQLMMAVMIAGMAAGALADVSFSYSGQLRTETGGKVTAKNPKITFSLYNVATGGAALWSRMIPVLLDDNGYFAVELSNANGSPVGSVVDLEQLLANNATLYIGLTVDGSSGEIAPRQKLISTPRAAFAEDVQTAKQGFTVNGAAVFVNGLQIGSGTSAKAQIKADGTIVTKSLSIGTEGGTDGKITVNGAVTTKSMTISGDVKVNSVLDATTVKQGGNVLIPSGVVVMWSGAVNAIPAGWALCNGQNGTPDLRGRFIVGYDPNDGDYNGIGKNGGEKKVKLTVDEMPAHRHKFLSDDQISGKNDTYAHDCDGYNRYNFDFDSSGGTRGRTYQNESVGGSQSHENRPPYYALAYIMKL